MVRRRRNRLGKKKFDFFKIILSVFVCEHYFRNLVGVGRTSLMALVARVKLSGVGVEWEHGKK